MEIGKKEKKKIFLPLLKKKKIDMKRINCINVNVQQDIMKLIKNIVKVYIF